VCVCVPAQYLRTNAEDNCGANKCASRLSMRQQARRKPIIVIALQATACDAGVKKNPEVGEGVCDLNPQAANTKMEACIL